MTQSDRQICAGRVNQPLIMGLGALSVIMTLIVALYLAAGGTQ